MAKQRFGRDQFLVFGAPAIEQAEIDEVVDSLRSRWLGTGPKVARFEEAFRAYKGAPHAVAVNSCTAALHLSLLAAGVGPGDEVILPALTFCATVNAIVHTGATPVPVDIDPVSMNLDSHLVNRSLTPKTRALLPVHFAGRPCDMGSLCAIASRHGLVVIEDCAHAIEAEYGGQKAGTFGDFGCFSFYATKNVTCGEGGMILTRDPDQAARLKVLALHGLSDDAWKRFSDEGYRHYLVVASGFKYNMMDLQAAIGLHQLARVEGNWIRRREIWDHYNRSFSDLPIVTPARPDPGTRHAFHLYTVLVDEKRCGVSRDSFLVEMTKRMIGVGVHYLSISEYEYYCDRFGWRPEDFPHATAVGRSTVSLPLSPALSDHDVDDVVGAVREILTGSKG